MKKKFILSLGLTFALLFIMPENMLAQSGSGSSYNDAAGMRIEFGSKYGTFAGFTFKHFFDATNAGEAQLLFGDGFTLLEVEYQYHGDIPNAPGLKWFFGFGPGFAFGNDATDFLLRPVGGLDYKIKNVPLNFTFDWRPAFVVTHGTDFNAARFGLGLRYAF
ncbi:hypothetical protein [Prolixibacter sp. SD074]|jgi:hypothetical protein|uniref:hypothetical protein n=1 Tax=Prolixibacter sp. SD074 TaxID=2652391 RepID=UPI0012784EDF|nr:hypothetical protein [Prolixibacter sp. SD074]GET28501.1 hypothetical protein SD074_07030 [Prolixibacter sp. SD074]